MQQIREDTSKQEIERASESNQSLQKTIDGLKNNIMSLEQELSLARSNQTREAKVLVYSRLT